MAARPGSPAVAPSGELTVGAAAHRNKTAAIGIPTERFRLRESKLGAGECAIVFSGPQDGNPDLHWSGRTVGPGIVGNEFQGNALGFAWLAVVSEIEWSAESGLLKHRALVA